MASVLIGLLFISQVSAFTFTPSSTTSASSRSSWGRITAYSFQQRQQRNGLLNNSMKCDGVSLGMAEGEGEKKKPLGLIIAGAPASGKGTQCETIKETYGVVHLSTGDMLRAAVAAKSEVGISAKEYMDSGKLVPDEVIIGVVKDRLDELDCRTSGWLLDGFPRTRAQADALAEAGITADCFVFLDVPDSVLVERVVGRRTDPETGKIYHMTFSPPDDEEVLARLVQRSDDTEEKVKVRLEQFHANVESVMGCYKDISCEIDGTGNPTDVSKTIRDAIDAKISA
eukprot:CAMPEP_0195517670 /NCGR_PEP_ID=MMETSP0794_2-20130614/11224_1 /TAXON_ID=515487 /ORGANISM="Stephanopyxis turris, Strain CCMP 815" /LENGTH=283 /DNA_ID=CAMNT_0040646509 /DNA_START=43 /DNA_END=894 /DNA_ORIENTATION=+